ncbi:MAG: 4-hydroxy-tetrahydrodipicolinate synthase [Deltaproteobacteria bacterium]|jgi:4-hydroxy-tetrahydrodipicolinate synthase|nr:4-hydroxy-tetrahydrodipicolinate synthase [Deltaproteobacteria bacterium]
MQLRGFHIPIITPFADDYSIDEASLRKLTNYCIAEQLATALVPCGTTGESPTLTPEEFFKVIKIVKQEANERVPIIAGAGTNSTAKTIELLQECEALEIAGALVVAPYYNKPNMRGILKHYEELAKNTKLPLIIYNIPGRTGINITPETIVELAKIENIIGLKDCCGDLKQTMQIIRAVRKNSKYFYVWTGDDLYTYTNLVLGGDGAISATAHILGKEYRAMFDYVSQNDFQAALKIHYKLMDLINVLFVETNPAPLKAALSMLGLCRQTLRLPLVSLSVENYAKVKFEMSQLGKI